MTVNIHRKGGEARLEYRMARTWIRRRGTEMVRRAWSQMVRVSGGSGGHFAGLKMAALHPLPRQIKLFCFYFVKKM